MNPNPESNLSILPFLATAILFSTIILGWFIWTFVRSFTKQKILHPAPPKNPAKDMVLITFTFKHLGPGKDIPPTRHSSYFSTESSFELFKQDVADGGKFTVEKNPPKIIWNNDNCGLKITHEFSASEESLKEFYKMLEQK